MNKNLFETRSQTQPRSSLHVLGESSRDEEVRRNPSLARRKIGLGVGVIALVGCCVMGFLVSNRRTHVIERPSPEQKRILALAEQLSSLTQTDLIVFPDGRVWYVRAIHGRNMEIVGWVGDNVRSENIDSFVLKDDTFTIVRHHDPAWQAQRDSFLGQ